MLEHQYLDNTTTLICKSIPIFFFFQAEDGIRDCLLSRGLGDVYKRQKEYIFNTSASVHLPFLQILVFEKSFT